MADSKSIVVYDIASGPPVTTFAPNPWKARMALNFKGAQYSTEWVDFPEVTSTRKKVGVPACRKWADGSDFYTLPVIVDHSNGETVGDSFDIALYLDQKYPGGPRLIPPSTVALHKAFNRWVDTLFTNNVRLFVLGTPFDPRIEEESRAIFLSRVPGIDKWEDLGLHGDERPPALAKFKEELEELAKVYKQTGGGPFLEEHVCYGDIVVGAWLNYVRLLASEDDWREILTWHDGLWGEIVKALKKYTEIK